jgi:hypothetical protein
MIVGMPTIPDPLPLDCDRCPADGSSACVDCVVTHLLANDQGPIHFLPSTPRPAAVAVEAAPAIDEVVGWFVAAGLVDDPPTFVDADPARSVRSAAVR